MSNVKTHKTFYIFTHNKHSKCSINTIQLTIDLYECVELQFSNFFILQAYSMPFA